MGTTLPARVPVDSSSIACIAYAPELCVLEVEFRRGPVYRYSGVSNMVFAQFLNATSKGAYFNASIRNCFPYEQV